MSIFIENGFSAFWNQNSSYVLSSVESQKGVIVIQRMFRWEPEGRYRCTKSMAIAPFWFSTEHLWSAITPFWLSTDAIMFPLFSDSKKSVAINKELVSRVANLLMQLMKSENSQKWRPGVRNTFVSNIWALNTLLKSDVTNRPLSWIPMNVVHAL